MTTIPKKLRSRLRKGNFVKNTPKTKRDPTFASRQMSNYARIPFKLRNRNTYKSLQALQRILKGDVSRARATPKDHHRDRATSSTNRGKLCGAATAESAREECDIYKRTMREKKGCRTNTAPREPRQALRSRNRQIGTGGANDNTLLI